MDKEIIELIKSIDCTRNKKYTNWLIVQYEIEPFDIEKVKDYLLKYYVLVNNDISSKILFKDINCLFKAVDNAVVLNYEITINNSDLIIYKPNSYINRDKFNNHNLHKYDEKFAKYSTIYCCFIKNNDIINYIGLNHFTSVQYGTNIKYYQTIFDQVYLDDFLINLDIKKYFIADNINDRISKETDHNIKLLEQEELHCDLYLYNYDYTNVKINCKKINGNVRLIPDFTIIPHFLKNIVITGKFDCRRNLLETLINCPQTVHSIDCCYNKLISLKGAPSYISGDFLCTHNILKKLDYSPRIICGMFNFSYNNIETFIGAPLILGSFTAYSNKITSLIGMTQIVHNDILLTNNKISNLEGLPHVINGSLYLANNKIKTLKNSPKSIKGFIFRYEVEYLEDNYIPSYDSNGNLTNEYDNGTTD